MARHCVETCVYIIAIENENHATCVKKRNLFFEKKKLIQNFRFFL